MLGKEGLDICPKPRADGERNIPSSMRRKRRKCEQREAGDGQKVEEKFEEDVRETLQGGEERENEKVSGRGSDFCE